MATGNELAQTNLTLNSNSTLGLPQTPLVRNLLLGVAVAVVIAVMAGVWMWSQSPDYRVLFSNFNDKDGGAIVASLQQQNIPYKISDGGGAILVPSNMVHDVRLRLAQQGLPKGGNVGFELMENQKLGTSQFLEQVNFQRALEGELARSIQALSSVQTARVHLAIPKSSVFVREQQKPTASVLLNLHTGRTLDQQQVSAIVHLVASSIPELNAKNVTIVDQQGNLLSDSNKPNTQNNLDPSQLKYLQDYQSGIVKRIESIITPIVGSGNVRAEATADIDFSSSEQAAEIYGKNTPPEAGSIRSQQSNESYGKGNTPASGVPGALSNQPPVPATAPIVANNAANTANTSNNANGLSEKSSTVNYEVDKTVRYTQQGMGGVKRLAVAIVVNYKSETDKNGKINARALTDTEKEQITNLAKEAMGFNKERGDTLNLVNSPFATPEKAKEEDIPLWKQPDILQTAKEMGKYILGILIILYIFKKFLQPTLQKIMGTDPESIAAREKALAEIREQQSQQELVQKAEQQEDEVNLEQVEYRQALPDYESNREMAKQLAGNEPKIVANVIKGWVNNE